MSLGKKVIFLLFIFILLAVYTINTFDYNKTLPKEVVKDETSNISNNFQLFLENAEKVKKEILEKFKEKNNEKTPTPLVEKEEVILKDNVVKKKEDTTKKISTQTENLNAEVKEENKSDTSKNIEEKIEVKKEEKEEIIEEIIEEPKVDTKMVQAEINNILKDKKIIFERRSTTITKKSILAIKDIAKILNKYDNLKVEVAGHTDSRGKASLNKKLSQSRSDSVKKALVYYGINKDRLTSVGYGEEFPIAKENKSGLSLINRRIEFNIVGVK